MVREKAATDGSRTARERRSTFENQFEIATELFALAIYVDLVKLQ